MALLLEHPPYAGDAGVSTVLGDDVFWRQSQGAASALSHMSNCLSRGSQLASYCDCLAQYPSLDSEREYHQDLYAEEAHKQETWSVQAHQQARYCLRILLQHSVF